MRSFFNRLFSRKLPPPFVTLACATAGLYVAAFAYILPVFDIAGDAPGYLQAMQVLNGESVPSPDFTPNRFLTTFLSVGTVSILGFLTGNYLASWFFVNTFYFFGLSFISYLLFRRVTGSEAGSILGALFVVGNYGVLSFGLNYLMDLTGWFWFMVSLLFLFMHIESQERRHLWYAALAAGIGGIFKEYAYFGLVPIGLYLLYVNYRRPLELFKSGLPLMVVLVPTLLVHAGVYLIYGYSYLDWYGMNAEVFAFDDWAWNAGRSYLVVLSFLLPIALVGMAAFVSEMRRAFDPARAVFVGALVIPALAVLAWPIITERLVFLAVPLAALLAAFAVKRYERRWEWFGFIWLLYVELAVTTDKFILNYLYSL